MVIRFRDEWLYVYLAIEFQSTVDPFMALRMMVYGCSISTWTGAVN